MKNTIGTLGIALSLLATSACVSTAHRSRAVAGREQENRWLLDRDLPLEDARELAIKSDLVAAIYRTIAARGFKNQTEAAARMGIEQPRFSKLIRGHFDEYSVEKLLEFLAALGNNVEIRVSRHARAKRGYIRVRAA